MWYSFIKTAQNLTLPPVHDGCRCKIETMPAGNQIWQFSNNCCQYCKNLALEFNRSQQTEINEPATLNPVVPEEPAVIPEEVGEEPQIPEKTTKNYRFTPRNFFEY